MNRERIINAIADTIAGARKYGSIAELMIASEREEGNEPVRVGAVKPFAVLASDWVDGAVISVTPDGEGRIVAVLAHRPGNGALRRLVNAIIAAGLRPVIIEPVGEIMPAILSHWGWKRTVRGHGFERVEEWRPPVQNRPTVTDPGMNP